MRPTWAEIDLNSLRENFRYVKSAVGAGMDILSVVKADAYGHGAVPISRALVNEGTYMLGVATVNEALELRGAGITKPIVMLGGVVEEEAEAVVGNDLIPAVFSVSVARALNSAARKREKSLGFHLKVDTGMNRLGVYVDEIADFLDGISGLDNIRMEGLFSHFASAELDDATHTMKQLEQFTKIAAIVKKVGFRPRYLHLANSAAIQRFPETHLNMVRPGIMLYGSSQLSGHALRPVMKLKSRVVQIKKAPKGSAVSYGGTFLTQRPTLLAVLPIGYADGYMRTLSNNGSVSVRGQRAPVVGAVCMDLTIIDVTDVPGVEVGEEVVLFGDAVVTVDDVSTWAGTISYELLSNTGRRVSRKYVCE